MSSTDKPAPAGTFTNRNDSADLLATQIDPAMTQISGAPGGMTMPPAYKQGGTNPSLLALSSATGSTNLRNLTVLPHVEGTGTALTLKPRAETRYENVRQLGVGAMGEVNLVRDNDIGRTVAMKKLVARTQNPVGVARFIDEIRTIGHLEHPNIVPIYDVGVEENGEIFFVMKHIDGETLEEIISKLDAGDPDYLARYTLDYRVEIFLGLLRALQCAHAKGIIHRDIKPAKVSSIENSPKAFLGSVVRARGKTAT
jgi:serine/threonine-protein kinase